MKKVTCDDGSVFEYGKLCLCSGATPRLLFDNDLNGLGSKSTSSIEAASWWSEHVLGLRDTQSVRHFSRKLASARRLLIVGNGGIATELAYEIERCHIVWAIKDEHISHVYLDAYAAKFFDRALRESTPQERAERRRNAPLCTQPHKYSITSECVSATVEHSTQFNFILFLFFFLLGIDMKYEDEAQLRKASEYGSALGPDWSLNQPISGASKVRFRLLFSCLFAL